MAIRRRVRRIPLDVFENPFASLSKKGVRRIHRNDGRFAKPTWSTRKGIRLKKRAARANPLKDAKGRVHRNDGKFAKPPWSRMAKYVKSRKAAPIPWKSRMLSALRKKSKGSSESPASRHNPFLSVTGRVHRNDGRFAKPSWSRMAHKITARSSAGIPWFQEARENPFATRGSDGVRRIHRNDGRFAKPTWSTRKGIPLKRSVRDNPTGWNDDLDLIFSNPTGKAKSKAKSKATKSKAKSKAPKSKAKSKAPKSKAKSKAPKSKATKSKAKVWTPPFRMLPSSEHLVGGYRFAPTAGVQLPWSSPIRTKTPRIGPSKETKARAREARLESERMQREYLREQSLRGTQLSLPFANPTRRRKTRRARR